MMDASEEAEVDEAPGEECSANIVVPWAIQELSYICQWTDDVSSKEETEHVQNSL